MFKRQSNNCAAADPQDTLTDRLNTLLNSSGPGYVLSLCPSTQYYLEAPLLFTFPEQEISTEGYPTGDERATLVVSGPVINGIGQTTAVDGTCPNCSGVILRNVQINGTRLGAPPIDGGGNIEFGGPNSNQLVEYVHSFDPRSWSCLHVAEGSLNCNNVTVRNNDIGPSGSDAFQEWADGISMSCANSFVQNNMINNPTDGGVVIFGSPGTLVENNTIWVETQVLLGGINMVDYEPWLGNYSGTVVRNNTIIGGFANETPLASNGTGVNSYDTYIKIGIAVGPETWFGSKYGTNISTGGTILDNQFTGAFSYGIAVSSANDFTIQNNVVVGNYSFIGAIGPNCSSTDITPAPAPFIIQLNSTSGCTVQSDFQDIPDGGSLTCVVPPPGGDYWPYGGNPGASSTPSPASNQTSSGGSSTGKRVGLGVGITVAVLAVILGAWLLHRWAVRRSESRKLYPTSRSGAGYVENKHSR